MNVQARKQLDPLQQLPKDPTGYGRVIRDADGSF